MCYWRWVSTASRGSREPQFRDSAKGVTRSESFLDRGDETVIFKQVQAARRRNTLHSVSLYLVIVLCARRILPCYSGTFLFIEYKLYLGIFFFLCERLTPGAGAVHQLAMLLVSRAIIGSGPPRDVCGVPREDVASREIPGCIPRRRGMSQGGPPPAWWVPASPGVTWVNPG